MEMGTGKTKVLIDNLSMLYDKGKVDGALIIAPKGVGVFIYQKKTKSQNFSYHEWRRSRKRNEIWNLVTSFMCRFR